MARFDVHRLDDGGMVIDCQADFLDDIGTRFVVPLLPPGETAPDHPRLNPRFDVNGEMLVMVTQLASTLRTTALRNRVVSLDREHFRIINAIDVLIGSG